jgi:hypothetical protein
MVSDYRLDDRVTGVQSTVEAEEFPSSLFIQTSSEVHPASYPVGPWSPFLGSKACPGRDAIHSSHLVPRLRMSENYTHSPPCRLHGGSGTGLFLLLFDPYQTHLEILLYFHCLTILYQLDCLTTVSSIVTSPAIVNMLKQWAQLWYPLLPKYGFNCHTIV